MVLVKSQINIDYRLTNMMTLGYYDEVISTLKLNKQYYDAVDSSGSTLLHLAVESRKERFVKHLLEFGAKVDAQDNLGKTPLMRILTLNDSSIFKHSTFEYEKYTMVEILLESNANIHLCDKEGTNAWQMLKANDASVVQLLVKKLNKECSGSKSIARVLIESNCPLFIAVLTKDIEVVKIMLNHGVPILDLRTQNSALLIAIQELDDNILEFFLKRGVDFSAHFLMCKLGQNYENTEQHLKILKILLNHGGHEFFENEKMSICDILEKGNREVISILFQYGLDCRAKDSLGKTALHYLALNRNPCIIEEVRGKDFDFHHVDKSGVTALHLSVQSPEFLKFLIEKGADVNSTGDGNSMTPLFLGYKNIKYFDDQLKSIEILLKHGADPQLKHQGQTIFEVPPINYTQEYLAEPIIAHLVMLEALGISIDQTLMEKIKNYSCLEKSYNKFNRQIDRMKNYFVHDSLNLFTLLTVNERRFDLYIRNRDLAENFLKLHKKCVAINVNTPLYNILRRRLADVIESTKLKKIVGKVIFEMSGFHYHTHHIIVDNILKNFSLLELRKYA